MFAIAVTRI